MRECPANSRSLHGNGNAKTHSKMDEPTPMLYHDKNPKIHLNYF